MYLVELSNDQPLPVVLHVDGYNPAPAGPGGNQGQMMAMSGRGGAIGGEGTANMGTQLMSENGAMVMYQDKHTVKCCQNIASMCLYQKDKSK